MRVLAALLLFVAVAITLAMRPAQADPKLYAGTLVVHTFGNQVTTGTGTTMGGMTSTGTGNPTVSATSLFLALPLGAFCSPGAGGTSCGITTLTRGAPLTGSGTASVSTGPSPVGFTLPAGVLRRTTSGSLPGYPTTSSRTTASVYNGPGSFSDRGGPGDVSYEADTGQGMVYVTPGKNRFGGTLRILGSMRSSVVLTSYGYVLTGGWSWLWPVIGGSYAGMTSGPLTLHATAYSITTSSPLVASGFSWTTGTVSLTATRGGPTVLTSSGYDNRTPLGGGTIQLVTPQLVHWGSGSAAFDTGAIAILNLRFVAEPAGWLVLLAGVGLLGVLYRRRSCHA